MSAAELTPADSANAPELLQPTTLSGLVQTETEAAREVDRHAADVQRFDVVVP
jgi:hypothetical protein